MPSQTPQAGANVLEIPQGSALEIPSKPLLVQRQRLEDLLKSVGIDVNEKAAAEPSALAELIQRNVYEPLQKTHPDIALPAANAVMAMALSAPLIWDATGIASGAKAATEASTLPEVLSGSTGGAKTTPTLRNMTFNQPGSEWELTSPYAQTKPFTPQGTGIMTGGELGGVKAVQEPTGLLGPYDFGHQYAPVSGGAPESFDDWARSRGLSPQRVRQMMQRANRPIDLTPEMEVRPQIPPNNWQVPPYRTDIPPRADPQIWRRNLGSPSGRMPYHYSLYNREPQAAAPVRSLPPYEPYSRYAGKRPTQGVGGFDSADPNVRAMFARTRGLGKSNKPTGMMDNPDRDVIHPGARVQQAIGESYLRGATNLIPKSRVKPGLVVYTVPNDPEQRTVILYSDAQKNPLAGAVVYRRAEYRNHQTGTYEGGGVGVAGFGSDTSKGLAAHRAATEVTAAMYRLHPHGGVMTQYSNNFVRRLRHHLLGPPPEYTPKHANWEALYRTRKFTADDIKRLNEFLKRKPK